MTFKLILNNCKYNKIFKIDPCKNKKKDLIINYTDINNIKNKFVSNENNNFSLTSISSIDYAYYGLENQNINVTDILKKLLISKYSVNGIFFSTQFLES